MDGWRKPTEAEMKLDADRRILDEQHPLLTQRFAVAPADEFVPQTALWFTGLRIKRADWTSGAPLPIDSIMILLTPEQAKVLARALLGREDAANDGETGVWVGDD